MSKKKAYWIQAWNKKGEYTGSFDGIDMPESTFEEILAEMKRIPTPPEDPECIPGVGLSDGSFIVNRYPDGSLWLVHQSETVDHDQLKKRFKEVWDK